MAQGYRTGRVVPGYSGQKVVAHLPGRVLEGGNRHLLLVRDGVRSPDRRRKSQIMGCLRDESGVLFRFSPEVMVEVGYMEP